tara:strand:+ start:292 stop:540 length:249 start_codon:yes stop_codon:yes gene_type:complete
MNLWDTPVDDGLYDLLGDTCPDDFEAGLRHAVIELTEKQRLCAHAEMSKSRFSSVNVRTGSVTDQYDCDGCGFSTTCTYFPW